MLLKKLIKSSAFYIISCKPVYVQRKDKYTREQEDSREKERFLMKRGLKAGNFRNHEK